MKKGIIERKIEQLIKAAGELKAGFTHIEVKQDDDCPALKTERIADCNCQPDVKVVPGDHNAN